MATTTKKAINLPAGLELETLQAKLKHEKQVAFKYQKRRHNNWNQIYELYRDIVRVNRLTQRQAINIPLMKETIKTVGSRINEKPDIHLESRGGMIDKEIIANEIWHRAEERSSFELLDRADKKQEQLYGRSHFVLNLDKDGEVSIGVKDIFELLIDPKVTPYDIETARFTIETNIYKPLNEVTGSKKYDADARTTLKRSYEDNKSTGTINSAKYKEQMKAANERLKSLGIENVEDLEGYDKIVALDGHITNLWDKDKEAYVRYYVLVANESIILRCDTLLNTIGVEFYPYEGWADDMELTDYWSDGTGDMIRVPNQVINTWISQYMENRTLRSFGMNFYDSTIEGFTPQGFEPRPFGWYPLPGKPAEVFQRVDIPEINGTLEDIQFLVNIAEKASATGAVDKGAVEDVKRTLGEVEIAVTSALKRTNDMAAYYDHARKRLVEKWLKMTEANMPDGKKIKLYKKRYDGTYEGREVTKEDWYDPDGYKVEIYNTNQRLLEQTDEITRLKAVQAEYPNNLPLKKAIQKRMIGLVKLTPAEMDEIGEYEEQQATAIMSGEGQIVPPEIAGANEALKALQKRSVTPPPVGITVG